MTVQIAMGLIALTIVLLGWGMAHVLEGLTLDDRVARWVEAMDISRAAFERLKAREERLRREAEYRASQRSLNRMGYNAGIEDGLPGPRTKAAMNAWAKDVWASVRGGKGSDAHTRMERMNKDSLT